MVDRAWQCKTRIAHPTLSTAMKAPELLRKNAASLDSDDRQTL